MKKTVLILFICINVDLIYQKAYNIHGVTVIMRFVKTKTFYIFMIILLIFVVRHCFCISNMFYVPEYQKQSIDDVLAKDVLTDEDYSLIFSQTGISPASCRDLIESDKAEIIRRIHALYFEKPKSKKHYIFFPVTCEEKTLNQKTPMVPLKDGDVLITFNTHTLDWRHGHAAIVTDATCGEILEHKSIGNKSMLSHIESWQKYPAFIILRHTDEEIAKKAASYAKETLVGIDYNLFTGFIKKDKSDENNPSGSHCSHIVWQAYKAAGIDVDYNGGSVVTPADIARSETVKTVQVFGINPDKYRLNVFH